MSENQAISLLLCTMGAFLIPLLSRRIGLPAAACEMLYGALLGNVIPQMAQPNAFITALANFGYILLRFLAGLEVDFLLVEREGKREVLRSAAFALGVLGAGIAGASMLGRDPLFGLIVGAISIGVVLVILRETGLSRSRFGQITLISGGNWRVSHDPGAEGLQLITPLWACPSHFPGNWEDGAAHAAWLAGPANTQHGRLVVSASVSAASGFQ